MNAPPFRTASTMVARTRVELPMLTWSTAARRARRLATGEAATPTADDSDASHCQAKQE